MSRLDNFLAHHVENYLFYDIVFMEQDDKAGRGVGYPLLMTCCAGIEFLGALMSAQPFDVDKRLGHQYFAEYWQNRLYPNPSPNVGFYRQTYQLVRHGIAHSFFAKGSIVVVRKQPVLHFTRDPSGLLFIDAVQLGRDLIASYLKSVKPILTNPARATERATMEVRLSEMESQYWGQAAHLGLGNPVAPTMGVTGPTGFITKSIADVSGSGGPTGPLSFGP